MYRMSVEDSERMVKLYYNMWALSDDTTNLNAAIIAGQEMEEIRKKYNERLRGVTLRSVFTYHSNVWFDHTVIQKYLDCDCWILCEVFYLDPEVSEADKVFLCMKWNINVQ